MRRPLAYTCLAILSVFVLLSAYALITHTPESETSDLPDAGRSVVAVNADQADLPELPQQTMPPTHSPEQPTERGAPSKPPKSDEGRAEESTPGTQQQATHGERPITPREIYEDREKSATRFLLKILALDLPDVLTDPSVNPDALEIPAEGLDAISTAIEADIPPLRERRDAIASLKSEIARSKREAGEFEYVSDRRRHLSRNAAEIVVFDPVESGKYRAVRIKKEENPELFRLICDQNEAAAAVMDDVRRLIVLYAK